MTAFRHVVDVGSGRPIVFLHGWSAHGGFFAPQLGLAASHRVLVPDLPGHGRDRRPGATLSIGDLARELDRLLTDRALDDVLIVGWSMGAFVAFEHLAARDDARVSGLVVVDMTARVVNDADWRLGLASGLDAAGAERAALSMARDWPRYARRVAPSLFAAGLAADHPLQAFARTEIAANDGDTLAGLWRSLARADYRAAVRRLPVPCLVVTGAASQLYRPGVGDWLAAAIPHARHTVLAAAGHSPHLEQPAAFNALVAAMAQGGVPADARLRG